MEVGQEQVTTMESHLDVPHSDTIPRRRLADGAHHSTMERDHRLNTTNVKVCCFCLIHRCNVRVNLAHSFYCFGPAKPPIEMSNNEMVAWNQHLQTPILFNHHQPYEVNSTTIQRIDLNPIASTPRALSNKERVLILTPLRDASPTSSNISTS